MINVVDNISSILSAITNFFNKLFFWWMKDLFWPGKGGEFQSSDLCGALKGNNSASLGDSLEEAWINELYSSKKSRKKPSLWRAIAKTYRLPFFKCSIFIFFYVIITILNPVLLESLIAYFEPATTKTKLEAYAYATAMFALLLLQTTFLRHGFLELSRVGMRAKIACSSLVYKKIVRLSCSSISKNTGGSIVNLLSNDVARFESFPRFLPFLFVIPLQMGVVVYLIWRYVGYAALIAISCMLLQTVPLQALFYKLSYKLRSKLAARRDERIFLIGEIINGIRTIKMNVWEKPFERIVYLARSREIKVYIQLSHMTAVMYASAVFSQRLALFLTILAHKLLRGVVRIGDVVPIAQYLYTIRTALAVYFAENAIGAVEVNVSIKRMEEFLLLDEVQTDRSCGGFILSSNDYDKGENNTGVSIKKVSASYGRNSAESSLHDINLDVRSSELCIVGGSVGSGKSSILKLILRELHVTAGDVYTAAAGSISYASQEPWLFNGSLRDNVLFGVDYDEERYYRVTEACALRDDFDQLPYGDRTLVGERGMSLSGGQCARVNLARAVYRNADIYLFDDPFSAVDTRVAKKIFDDCVNGLLKDKTRIVVSHNAEHFGKADLIVLMDKGRIEFQGKYEDFRRNNRYTHLVPLKPTFKNSESKIEETMNDAQREKFDDISDILFKRDTNDDEQPKETEEELLEGRVSKSLYWKYIRASGSCVKLIVLMALGVAAILSICGFDYWTVKWTEDQERTILNLNNDTVALFESSLDNPSFYIFGASAAAVVLLPTAFAIIFFVVVLTSNRNIHNKMFDCLMKTPLRFFETNPAGRILNRFSEDTGTVDNLLPLIMYEASDVLFIASAVLVPTLIANWWNVAPMMAFGYVCYRLSKAYVWTIQRLRRMEGIAKSPIFTFATASLAGISTIRSCRAEKIVCRNFNSLLDNHTSVHYFVLALGQAFSFWLEVLTAVFFAVVAYGCIVFKSDDTYAGYIGMSLIQLNEMSVSMAYAMIRMIETFALMTSVERMFQFTKLEPEEPAMGEIGLKDLKDWPSSGRVEFRGLRLRYGDEDCEPILKDVEFVIEPKMKVGVVGRTGAGKSSLISALFRLAKIEGSLLIDGVDIKDLELSTLRSKISIIPQEPILFSTSLRANLDPFGQYEDAKIWSALEDVGLRCKFNSLDEIIDRGGSNLSSGQRQLICLARAVVKGNRILVMDEATANIDPTTDALIQRTIRSKFDDCTVLTVAHRLITIMDSDKVLVMDNGRVVEYDHPHVLLEKENGYLSRMVSKAGEGVAKHLKEIAELAFIRNSILTSEAPDEITHL